MEHGGDLCGFGDDLPGTMLLDVAEACGELDLGLQFEQRATCLSEKNDEGFVGQASGAFRDVARNGNRGTANLAGEPEGLLSGKGLGQGVEIASKSHGPLPHMKVSESAGIHSDFYGNPPAEGRQEYYRSAATDRRPQATDCRLQATGWFPAVSLEVFGSRRLFMSRSFNHTILALSIAIILVVLLGGFGPAGVSASQSDGAFRQMGVYEEVLHKIQTDYVTDPNLDKVTVGALHGLLESLDADSSYLTQSEYATYLAHQHEGVARIGIDVSKRFGYGSVVSVMPGTPAANAHIEDGDLIESIGGQSTREMSVAMIRLLLEGKAGTTVSFDLVRRGKAQPDAVTLTRTNIVPPPLDQQVYENSSILYLKPTVLTRERVDEIIARLRQMAKDGNKKVLLDLRDVSEGDAQQGIRLANAFLQSGTIGMLTGQTVPMETFTADASKFVTGAPLVVLVNHGTAGAAEIVAGAIMDDHRGDVVGDRTFGEGAEEKTFTLPDGGALLLTVAKYETPSGKKIEDVAVTPNVPISEPLQEMLPTDENPAPQEPRTDDQLTKGLAILKGKAA